MMLIIQGTLGAWHYKTYGLKKVPELTGMNGFELYRTSDVITKPHQPEQPRLADIANRRSGVPISSHKPLKYSPLT